MKDDASPVCAKLRLADHVRACTVGEQVVLLDLARTRYFGLSGDHARTLINAMGAVGPCSAGDETVEDEASLRALLRQRILTPAPARQPQWQPPFAAPTQTLSNGEAALATAVRARDLGRFAAAAAMASIWLRCRSLLSIVNAVSALQRRCPRQDTKVHQLRLEQSVARFNRLRPLTFTSREKCLFDSIAMTLFLARQDLAVQWVIGVAIRPFQAHSWVQHHAEVLNDTHENVCRFTPILVV